MAPRNIFDIVPTFKKTHPEFSLIESNKKVFFTYASGAFKNQNLLFVELF